MSRARLAGMALGAAFRPRRRVRPFTPEEIARAAPEQVFPPGFLMGASTAAHQVEGGNENDWTEWERATFPDGTPHIRDRTQSGLACDSYRLFDEDLRLLKELGANAYRFSVEWARLEPAEGVWNQEAADHYRSWLEKLSAAGIKSMVTLYHFTLPRWVSADGAWQSDRTIDRIVAYTRRAAEAFGRHVDLWCTLNEPNVVAIFGYLQGTWPPGVKDDVQCAQAIARQMKAHARMAEVLREKTGKPVGIAHHVRLFQPASWSPMDKVVTRVADAYFNEAVAECHRTGRIQLLVPGKVAIDEAVPGLKGSFDYLGINYYTRSFMQADFKDPTMARQFVPEGRPVSDLGWDIYPEGLYLMLKRFARLGLPIYVTENGISDASGALRADYLRSHFYAMEAAAREGVDLRGYFHWSLMDNFEWAEGFSSRFGLYRVDYDHPRRARTPTPAVATFQELARRVTRSKAS